MPLTIYKSSAGSGKTYTLVVEYLTLVLSNTDNIKSTLAVTFTNKATNEMKVRIVEALVSLSGGEQSDISHLLQARTVLTTDEIRTRALLVLKSILHNYARFSIMTIDSFFNSVVNSISKELQIPLNFELELKQEKVKQALINQLFNNIETDNELKNILLEFASAKMADDKGWNIQNEIGKLANELFSGDNGFDNGFESLTQNVDALNNALRKNKKNFEAGLKLHGERFLNFIHTSHLTIDDFKFKSKGFVSWFYSLAGETGIEKEISKRVMEVYDDSDEIFGKSQNPKAANKLLVNEIQQMVRAAVHFYNQNIKDYINATCALKYIHVLKLFSRLSQQLKQYRNENNTLLLSDVAHMINNFVTSDDAPFIYEKTGSRFLHCFIDEFQDTSNIQWKNFQPLIDNILAAGNKGLIVGDVKQSIYRWRGGNMNLLASMVSHNFKHYGELVSTLNLETNYRSKRNIVTFNNELFSWVSHVFKNRVGPSSQALLDRAYGKTELVQKVAPNNLNSNAGFVKIEWIRKNQATANALPDNDNVLTGITDNALDAMYNDLQKLLALGFAYKDITILVRTAAHGAFCAEFLQSMGILEIITPDSFHLAGSLKISFIISWLQLLTNTQNESAVFALLKNHDALPQKFQNQIALHKLIEIFKEKSSPPATALDELVLQFIAPFGFTDFPDAYITRFFDLIHQLKARNITTIPAFLSWWDENKRTDEASITLPDDHNAISIMTIHKAKGLQFAIVMMPFVDWQLKPHNNEIMWVRTSDPPFNGELVPVAFKKDLLRSSFANYYQAETDQNFIDNTNLMYVAFTRAEQGLFLYAKETKANPDPEKEINLSSANVLLSQLLSMAQISEMVNSENIVTIGSMDDMIPRDYKESLPKDAQAPYAHLRNISPRFEVTIAGAQRNSKAHTGEKIKYGLALHNVLAEIKSSADIEMAITRWSIMNAPDEAIIVKLRSDINKIITMPELSIFFSTTGRLMCEREIGIGGKSLRPDRVVINGTQAHVIDYKTGEPHTSHKAQINEYADTLSTMGYDIKSRFILYTENISLLSA